MNFYTHPTYKKMIELIFSSVPKNTKIRLLDFGCGSGYLFNILSEHMLERYTGFDVNKEAIVNAKANINSKIASFNFIKTDKQLNLGPPKSQDIVIAIGVLQYLTDEEVIIFINEAKRVLKKRGTLLISTVTDHYIYRILSIYRLFLPNRFLNKIKLINKIRKAGFKVTYQKEFGLIIGPLISHNLTLLPDTLDKLIFLTKGTLGFFGNTFRRVLSPVMYLEYFIPIDYGYTLYVSARKE